MAWSVRPGLGDHWVRTDNDEALGSLEVRKRSREWEAIHLAHHRELVRAQSCVAEECIALPAVLGALLRCEKTIREGVELVLLQPLRTGGAAGCEVVRVRMDCLDVVGGDVELQPAQRLSDAAEVVCLSGMTCLQRWTHRTRGRRARRRSG
jgi:hypothetical protein